MSVLLSAAPVYLSIGTGLFSLYLYYSSTYNPLASCRVPLLMCMLVPFLLVTDSIVALAILSNEDPPFGLVHIEYALQSVVRLSLNLLMASILHPNTLSVFLARPAFDYRLQAVLVWVVASIATCTSILDIIASFISTIPPIVSLLTITVSFLTLVLLLRVAIVSSKWNLSTSVSTWYLFAVLQLSAVAVAVIRAWSPTTILNVASHFTLLVWTVGTLLAVSNLSPSSLSKPPTKAYPLTQRRISHTTVSEDFQSNRDPFAGPHQHRYHPSIVDDGCYYGDDRSSRRKQGAIRTQYSSESSTHWLLSNPQVKSLPSLPPPVHLEPPIEAISENTMPSVNESGPPLQTYFIQETLAVISRDRTPTQSLYVPETSLGACPCVEGRDDIATSPDIDFFPSTTSFELDTPDQTFSSEADMVQVDDSVASHNALDDGNLVPPVSMGEAEVKDLVL